MVESALSNVKAVEVSHDIGVHAEVGHLVVEFVSKLLLGVLVLGAARGVADGVRLKLEELESVESMADLVLSASKVALGGDHVGVELRLEVVVDVLGLVVVLFLGLIGAKDDLMVVHFLRDVQAVKVGGHIGVNTEVRHLIVEFIAELLLGVLVLSAAGRVANRVGGKLSEASASESDSESFLSLSSMLESGGNIGILAKARHSGVVLGELLALGDGKGVVKLALNSLNRIESASNLGVLAEAGDGIVDRVALGLLERSIEGNTGLLLSVMEVLLGLGDLFVLAEVGHEVVLGVFLGLLEGGLHLITIFFLGGAGMGEGMRDVLVLSEAGDWVVDLEVGLGTLGLLVPSSASVGVRTVLLLYSGGLGQQQSQNQ